MAYDTLDARSVQDGYRRGWGLCHSTLGAEVSADPLFQAAIEASAGLSLLSKDRLKNLFLIVRDGMMTIGSQNIIEFGSYRGGTALFLASLLASMAPQAYVYALDTFEGMPPTDDRLDLHGRGDFSDTSASALRDRAAALGLCNLIVVPGLFQDTFSTLDTTFGLAHIDCDLIDGVRYAQRAVWPQMAAGGYVVFDDSNTPSCLGATQAVEEMIMERRQFSEQAWPHHVFRA